MTLQATLNYLRWLADETHSQGMDMSLKNTLELIDDMFDKVNHFIKTYLLVEFLI